MLVESPIDSNSASLLLEEALEKSSPILGYHRLWRDSICYGLQGIVFIANLVIFISTIVPTEPRINECAIKLSNYSPAIDAITTIEERYLDGAFYTTNVYKGIPNDQLNEAWENITRIDLIPLSEQDVQKIGKDPQLTVKFPPGNGSESKPYGGSVELFHQLHCLNRIRQWIYIDYYNDLKETDGIKLSHIDHCIDILRQVLMCNGDVGIVTTNRAPFIDHPTPDFSTRHKCRDFNAIYAWMRDHASELG